MKKTSAVFLILIMTVLSASGCSAQGTTENSESTEIILTINQPVMLVNGTPKNIDAEGTAPIIADSRTLLPVRAVVEAMDGTVEWDGTSQTVTLTRNSDTVQLTIGSDTALLNNQVQTLDTVPVVINDRTMLPIRFIAESFHFQVEWNEENRQVIITDTKSEEIDATTPQGTEHSETAEKEPAAEKNENRITISVNEKSFTVTLEDNDTARAFREMLPLTLNMDEMNGNEKFYYLDRSLPSSSKRVDQIRTGDIMLYGSNCIVTFFKTFKTSYTYTPIGHIDDAQGYAAALSSGSVTVTFAAN